MKGWVCFIASIAFTGFVVWMDWPKFFYRNSDGVYTLELAKLIIVYLLIGFGCWIAYEWDKVSR